MPDPALAVGAHSVDEVFGIRGLIGARRAGVQIDDVILDGERSYTRSKLRPDATHPRLFGQQFESVDDGVNESVGGGGACVLGDVERGNSRLRPTPHT
jgi:hypothetical protein